MNFNFLPALAALIPVALLFAVIFREKKQREEDLKAPFRKLLYRLPGEYASQKARELSEKGEECLWAIFSFGGIAFAVILLSPPNPIVTVGILVGVYLCSAFCMPKLHKHYSKARRWRLGAIGERVVGDDLMREFLPKGFGVFHDIQQDHSFVPSPFNYDHILVDHRGVFLIETKTRSKKRQSDTARLDALTVKEESIYFPDGRFDHDTIPKLIKNAQELSDNLSEQLSHNIPVYPLLVFPGWNVSDKLGAVFPLCEVCDISKEVLKKQEKALNEKTVSRVLKYFEKLARNVNNKEA